METSMGLSGLIQRALLASGILASFLKVGTDVLAGMKWKGYNAVSQSISELIAFGAPTRPLVLSLDLVYSGLMIAFSIGIWQLAGQNQLMRIGAGLIAGNAVISAMVGLFLPMRVHPDGSASASTVHVLLLATAMFFFLFAIGFGGAAYRNWFRYYSYGTLAVYVILTIVQLISSPATAAEMRPKMVGVQERTMVAGYLLWVIALAIQHIPKLDG